MCCIACQVLSVVVAAAYIHQVMVVITYLVEVMLEAARIHQYILAGAAVVAVVTWVVEELGLIIEIKYIVEAAVGCGILKLMHFLETKEHCLVIAWLAICHDPSIMLIEDILGLLWMEI